jgi:hypothetical protein
MIYIITPYLSDFRNVCLENKWNPLIKRGMPSNPNIRWIFDWQQLIGRKIFKVDIIIWGYLCDQFTVPMFNRIEEEIEIRKKY